MNATILRILLLVQSLVGLVLSTPSSSARDVRSRAPTQAISVGVATNIEPRSFHPRVPAAFIRTDTICNARRRRHAWRSQMLSPIRCETTPAEAATISMADNVEVAPSGEGAWAIQCVSSIMQDSIQSVGSGDIANALQQSVALLNDLKHRANAHGAVREGATVVTNSPSRSEGSSSHLQILASSAVSATESLHWMVERENQSHRRSKKSSGYAWKALQSVVSSTFEGAAEGGTVAYTLAILAMGAVLAIDASDPTLVKMIASAVLPGDGNKNQKQKANRSEESGTTEAIRHSMARAVVLSMLRLAVDSAPRPSFVDLQTVAKIENGFGVGELGRAMNEGKVDTELAKAVADVVDCVFRQEDINGETVGNGDGDSVKLMAKERIAPTIGLVANIRPWECVDVGELARVVAERNLWYSAELLCDAAVESVVASSQPSAEGQKNVRMATSFPKGAATDALLADSWDASLPRDSIAHIAAGTIVDIALDERMYRRADVFASKYYHWSGPEKYAEARFMHACDTITKVVKKRQVQIIDKQIDRIDLMVSRVCKDLMLTPASTVNGGGERIEILHGEDTPIETMSDHIREFTLRRLRGSNNHSTATRLAKLWGWHYNQDPLVLEAEAKKRKLTYLQWDDEFCPGASSSDANGKCPLPLPEPISEPADLLEQVKTMLESSDEPIIGFDCEWHDTISGVALLQLSTIRTSLLVDIPALTTTKEGCEALRATVGKLFSRSTRAAHVIGFGCKDDIKRLRASPCVNDSHWFPPQKDLYTKDLRVVIMEASSQFQPHHFGLSRACEAFLGKQLDKAEQCSDWLARPLSPEQREYAALDAWACAAIAAKIFEGQKSLK